MLEVLDDGRLSVSSSASEAESPKTLRQRLEIIRKKKERLAKQKEIEAAKGWLREIENLTENQSIHTISFRGVRPKTRVEAKIGYYRTHPEKMFPYPDNLFDENGIVMSRMKSFKPSKLRQLRKKRIREVAESEAARARAILGANREDECDLLDDTKKEEYERASFYMHTMPAKLLDFDDDDGLPKIFKRFQPSSPTPSRIVPRSGQGAVALKRKLEMEWRIERYLAGIRRDNKKEIVERAKQWLTIILLIEGMSQFISIYKRCKTRHKIQNSLKNMMNLKQSGIGMARCSVGIRRDFLNGQNLYHVIQNEIISEKQQMEERKERIHDHLLPDFRQFTQGLGCILGIFAALRLNQFFVKRARIRRANKVSGFFKKLKQRITKMQHLMIRRLIVKQFLMTYYYPIFFFESETMSIGKGLGLSRAYLQNEVNYHSKFRNLPGVRDYLQKFLSSYDHVTAEQYKKDVLIFDTGEFVRGPHSNNIPQYMLPEDAKKEFFLKVYKDNVTSWKHKYSLYKDRQFGSKMEAKGWRSKIRKLSQSERSDKLKWPVMPRLDELMYPRTAHLFDRDECNRYIIEYLTNNFPHVEGFQRLLASLPKSDNLRTNLRTSGVVPEPATAPTKVINRKSLHGKKILRLSASEDSSDPPKSRKTVGMNNNGQVVPNLASFKKPLPNLPPKKAVVKITELTEESSEQEMMIPEPRIETPPKRGVSVAVRKSGHLKRTKTEEIQTLIEKKDGERTKRSAGIHITLPVMVNKSQQRLMGNLKKQMGKFISEASPTVSMESLVPAENTRGFSGRVAVREASTFRRSVQFQEEDFKEVDVELEEKVPIIKTGNKNRKGITRNSSFHHISSSLQ